MRTRHHRVNFIALANRTMPCRRHRGCPGQCPNFRWIRKFRRLIRRRLNNMPLKLSACHSIRVPWPINPGRGRRRDLPLISPSQGKHHVRGQPQRREDAGRLPRDLVRRIAVRVRCGAVGPWQQAARAMLCVTVPKLAQTKVEQTVSPDVIVSGLRLALEFALCGRAGSSGTDAILAASMTGRIRPIGNRHRALTSP